MNYKYYLFLLFFLICLCENVSASKRLVIHNQRMEWFEVDTTQADREQFAFYEVLSPDTAVAYYGESGKDGAVIIVNKSWQSEYPDADVYARDKAPLYKMFLRRQKVIAIVIYLVLALSIIGVVILLIRDSRSTPNRRQPVAELYPVSYLSRVYDFIVDGEAIWGMKFVFLILNISLQIYVGVMLVEAHKLSSILPSKQVLIWFIICYFFYMEYFCGRTLGKFLTKSIVVDEQGNKPTAKAILIRTLCRFIPFDCLSFLFYEEERAQGHCIFWHDKLSHTRVVQNIQSY